MALLLLCRLRRPFLLVSELMSARRKLLTEPFRMFVYAVHITGTVAGACNHQRLLPLLALCECLDALYGDDRLHPAYLRLKAHGQEDSQEGELAPFSTCTTQTESTNTLQLSETPGTQGFEPQTWKQDMLRAWRAIQSRSQEQLMTRLHSYHWHLLQL